MNEFLSEKEQVELIRQWWREYGWYLIGGMAISALGYFGWNQYQAQQLQVAEGAAALYLNLQEAVDDDSEGEANELLAQLRSDYAGSPYTDHAGLLIASDYLIADSGRAVDELRHVVASTRDRELGLIARLRLARVQAYREEYQDALEALDIEEPGQFAARISEIKGDIYFAQEETGAALAAYTDALTAAGSGGLDRNFVQMKLNNLRVTEFTAAEQAGQ